MTTLKTPQQILTHLGKIGRNRVKYKTALRENGTDMNETICLGFNLGLTAKQIVEALGEDPHTGRPIVGPARVFQIRDGK
jgi:hypothetical protein